VCEIVKISVRFWSAVPAAGKRTGRRFEDQISTLRKYSKGCLSVTMVIVATSGEWWMRL